MFAHTFAADDVQILLERIDPQYLSREERQALIDQGVHYNEVISREAAPSEEELALYQQQVERFGDQMAVLVNELARQIADVEPKPVLVSLVRAGTPTGILVKRSLAMMGIDAPHFSVSIVQGVGLDEVAIEHILSLGYQPSQLIFIDGWTGKGVVRRELSTALIDLSARYGEFRDELFVLSDIAGVAEHAATRDDVLIPSALLSGPLCGLVSRTIYRGSPEQPQLHGAAYLDYMANIDASRSFIDTMAARLESQRLVEPPAVLGRFLAAHTMVIFLAAVANEYQLDIDRIKPGVGESSRLFLRKKPRLLMVNSEHAPEVQHLLELARRQGVEIEVRPDMPYLACTLVK